MPYIESEKRPPWNKALTPLLSRINSSTPEGEVNYIITRILLKTNPKKYRDHEAILGRLVCIILEYYRRKVVPYERQQRKKNGDVYE